MAFIPPESNEHSAQARFSGDKATLIDPRFDSDSCGVGFVASSRGPATHEIVKQALTALTRLAHRGAVATDGKTSDGVGLLTGIPRALLLRATGLSLADDVELGAGMVFFPKDETRAEAMLERCLQSQDLQVVAWRDVPVNLSVLGEISLQTMPSIRQAMIVDATKYVAADAMEKRLYFARKAFERAVLRGETTGYVCSLSTKTIVYKAMCLGKWMADFYADLADPTYVSRFAIFHQRYATNTLPAWHRAQPSRKLGHNGEINTVWGNRARMLARDSTLPVECKPILSAGGTDSTSLDEAIELLSQNGRTIAEAVRMLMPPAVTKRRHPFLDYHGQISEPWDGPAAISFSDGDVVGAALDRNGLRPCRYAITDDGLVVAGSEAGLVDLDPERVIESGRLGPGEMLGVDMIEQKIYRNEEMMDVFDTRETYGELLEPEPLLPLADVTEFSPEQLLVKQRGFGYTKEDLKMILQPMAATGKDAVWSMGDDTPLAFLAHAPRPLYAFFRQRFAQVTNPAIDPLREAIVVTLHTRLGPWSHLLDKHAPLKGISLESPFLALGQVAALRAGKYPHAASLRLEELSCVFAPHLTLDSALEEISQRAVDSVRSGAKLLLLTDRAASAEQLPIPMAMAVGAVHQTLVQAGLRTLCGLAVEAGDCRDIHHAAVLIGYGAGALCPWLALETARGQNAIDGEQQMLHAFEAGLAKVMSKMGISVVDSYRGSGLFDILGLHKSVVERCFPGTPAPLSGIGTAEIDKRLRQTWNENNEASSDLPDFGWVRFRKSDIAEPHGWQPPTVKALQTVVGSARGVAASVDPTSAFAIFSSGVDQREAANLRDLLEIRPAGAPLDISEIEPVERLTERFVASAMSLGSLSPEAHQTITVAMNMLGARSNTGEGGEDPAVYRAHVGKQREFMREQPMSQMQDMGRPIGGAAIAEMVAAPAVHTGISLNNKIKQIASGRFGVTAEYLAHAEEIEIKVAQGAKPGEGGQLPGHKVSGLIARLRHAQPGVPLISPPPHHDIYSIEDLAQLIYDLKRVNPRAAIGVKLVSCCGVGTVAAGVAKAYADFIVIAGNTGGTGAAALSSIKYAGNPWELGLAEAQQMLVANGMRDRVRLRTDGGITTARDVLTAALLGADEYAFGTAVLVALGCDMARQCHLNTCPTGIATQKPELRAKFRGKHEQVMELFHQLAADLQRLLAKFGLPSLEAAIGRVDLLEQVRFDGNLDLFPMLAKPDAASGESMRRWMGKRNHRPGKDLPLDDEWTVPAIAAAKSCVPFSVKAQIRNEHRSVGARLAGELGLLRAKGEVAEEAGVVDVTFDMTGTAGQSFGAFAAEGMMLILTGQANDFVGKGLSGATLVIKPVGRAVASSHEHVLLGNVALYGATSGRLFAAGRAGERFAVRNSGATSVVEGIGDHGCEYMTGGEVVVLGDVGINFGAGMTGGSAWLLDKQQMLISEKLFHVEFLSAESFDAVSCDQQSALKALLDDHVRLTGSVVAQGLLAQWDLAAQYFVHFTPKPQA